MAFNNKKEKSCSVEIRALTPELSNDYFDFFENRAFTDDTPYRCYCQVYQMSAEQQKAEIENANGADAGLISRRVAQRQINEGVLRGYLAYSDGIAIGWCNANDKAYYSADHGAHFHAPAEKLEMAVVCFTIAPEYRGKGIATALLNRVLADAKSNGYVAVEAFPVTRSERYEWDCAGPIRLYENAGFEKVAEHDGFVIVRKEL